MAEVINLRLARKARKRCEAQRLAEANRARHGETKGGRLARREESERMARHIEGARRDPE